MPSSRDKTSNKLDDALLQKINAKSIGIDLFLFLERDIFATFILRDILKQEKVLDSTPKVSEVIIELGSMIDQVVIDRNRIRDASKVILTRLES